MTFRFAFGGAQMQTETADTFMRPAGTDEALHGRKVTGWTDQRRLAEAVGYTTRHIQSLEKKGLPNRGRCGEKEYPIPHATVWLAEYGAATNGRGEVVDYLPMAVAFARFDLFNAELDAEIHGALRERPRRR